MRSDRGFMGGGKLLKISRCYWPVDGQDETEAGREPGLHGLLAPLKLSQAIVFYFVQSLEKILNNNE